MINNKELVSIEKASNILGVCQETLRKWDRENKLKPIRTLGNHRRYSLKEIEKLLSNTGEIQNESTSNKTLQPR
jgi:excisionase family DNA binding protein